MSEFQSIKISEIEPQYILSKDGKIKNSKIQKELTPRIKNGYYFVSLKCNDQKYHEFSLHRLLATTFIPVDNQEDKIINHKNGDKLDNRIDNLEWITQKENIQHALKNELIPVNKKAVLQYSLDGIFINKYNSIQEAVEKTGCDRSAIIKVCKGKQKSSLGFSWKYDNEKDREFIDTKQMNEDSKEITNYPFYKIQRDGKVISIRTNKYLKPVINKNGHSYVTLNNKDGKKNFYIHNLVAEYYLGLNESKKVIHKNGDKSDNRLENLEITKEVLSNKKLSSTNQ